MEQVGETRAIRILLVEDSDDDVLLLRRHLAREGLRVELHVVDTAAAMRAALATSTYDLVITDYAIPQFSGAAAIALALAVDPELPVLVVSGTVGEDTAAEVMRSGARDFLLKGALGRLAMAIRREVVEATARRRARREAQLLIETQAIVRVAGWEWTQARGELFWTAGVHHLLGLPPGTPPSPSLALRCLSPEDGERLRALITSPGDQVDTDVRVTTVEGAHRVLQVSGRILRDAHGAVVRAVGTVLDVTERRQLEASLRLQDRLVAMGTVAAGVAHEINNPLTHLVAALPILVEAHRVAGGDAETASMLADCLDGAARIASIVRDLKVFSRPDESSGTCDVTEVLTSVLSLLNLNYRHAATIACDVPAGIVVCASPPRLAQVLTNLIINAVQAMPARPGRENRIEIRARADGGLATITVTDNGTGIPADVLPRVFAPFVTTKPVGTGTGLGLAVCREIVTAVGGAIDVAATGPHGTSFAITVNTSAATVPDAAPEARASSRPLRVLVVDDEPRLRTLAARLLRTHAVIGAGSVAEALGVLAEDPAFDVVLCDLMMPDRLGTELHLDVQVNHPALAARFVFASGGAVTLESQAFLETIVEERLLIKPYTREQLRAPVERVGAS